LEQYGGNDTHTDARSDIYSYGATLYHLLTNEPPTDARQRFLHPDSLSPPRKINLAVSPRTERAILWAMSLHPDDRPESIKTLRQFLSGQRGIPSRSILSVRPQPVPLLDTLTHPPENALAWVAAGLFLLSLVLTLAH